MPLAVVSGRLSRFEPTKRAGSTSCASGLYDGNSLTSTEHAFGSGAVYARMACVDVTPLTCKLPTAPYATDAVRTIAEILIFSILNSLGTRDIARSARWGTLFLRDVAQALMPTPAFDPISLPRPNGPHIRIPPRSATRR